MPRLLAAALIAVAAFVVVAVLHWLGAVTRLELLTHDARILSDVGRKPPRDDIVIAWLDQDAIDYMRRAGTPFPWPRSVYGDVIDYLNEGGAKAVVFDVLYNEPGLVAADDTAFGEALGKTKGSVMAFKFVGYREGGFTPAESERMLPRGLAIEGLGGWPVEKGFSLPIPEIEQPSDLLGFVNVRTDTDKVHRGYDLLRVWSGKAYPSLALAAAMATTGDRVAFDDAILRLGERTIATDAHGRMQMAFRGGPLTFPHVQLINIFESMLQVGEGKEPIYPAARFKDKVVLVGINAEGYADVVPTPLSTNFPGVELHATALDNLLSGDPLRRIDRDLVFAAAGALAGTVMVFALSGALWPALGLLALLALISASSFWLFAGGVLLPTAAPMLGTLLAGGGAFLWRLTFEGRKRREMKRAFTSYMAPEVVAEVLKNPDSIQLGGEVRQVTLLFTDLAGFTGLAEHMQPQELVAFLNDYFTRMCDRVLEQRGVIDKFIGDAIMAMFGAPVPQADHSTRAVHAALGMLTEMTRINADLRALGRPEVLTRIGIHTGEAVVGNMGSSKRFDYTAIGDTVNLASRLEGANKSFGTLCLVSEAAWQPACKGVLGREVGLVRVKGREQPIRVYEPLALGAGDDDTRSLVTRHQDGLRALREGRPADAQRAFSTLARERPDDALIALYCDRLAAAGWDGVFTLDAK